MGAERPAPVGTGRSRPVAKEAAITASAATTTCQMWRHQSMPRVMLSHLSVGLSLKMA
jgi:hypothetical protein